MSEMKLMMNIHVIVYKNLSIIEMIERISKIEMIDLRIEMKMIEMIVWELILFSIEIDHCMNFLIDIDRGSELLTFLMKDFSMRKKKIVVSENFLLLMTREMIVWEIVE